VEALSLIAAQGFDLAIVSNSDGTVAEVLAGHRICQLGPGAGVEVGCILDSAVIGLAKPDPAILHLALDRLGLGAGEAVYVGDTERYDVTCAIAAGIGPIHFDPYELCLHRAAHRHVRSLHELVE
jgi:putative hydrolase of the HAD superfamily